MRLPIPLGLETNPSRHPPAGAQFLLNMRAEITRSDSKATVPLALFRNEGVAEWLAGLAGAVRGMREMQDVLYVVAGTTLYSVDATPTATALGTVAGSGAVDMSGNGTELVIVNAAGTGYVWNESTDTFVTITDPDFVAAAWVEFLDQFMVFGRLDGEGFFLSALADALNYDALDTASAESAPDDIVMGKVVNRDLLLFGTKTLEVWYNAGLADFPLERAPGGTVEIGCAAKHSVAICDNAATWLARYRGGRSVRRLEGRTPRRISTPSLDDLFDSFATVDDAIGQSYTFGGHEFYTIIFPTEERTFTWDATAPPGAQWHERSYEYPGDLVSAFVPPSQTVPAFSDDDWTGDDEFTTSGGEATVGEDNMLLLGTAILADNQTARSADGITWSNITGGLGTSNNALVWSGKLGAFWGAQNGFARTYSSPDGNTWTSNTPNLTMGVASIIWVDTLELLVIGGAGEANPIYTSPDGITWTQRTAATDTIKAFAWNGSLLVAVGTKIQTSPDGITWTERADNFNGRRDVVWAEEIGLFVVVGFEGSTPFIETSPDGITWTSRTVPVDTGNLQSIAWNGTTLCAVANVGTHLVITSTDGVTWTTQTAVSGQWFLIEWFRGLFVAIESDTGDNEIAMTSPDGETWTQRALPTLPSTANTYSLLAVGSPFISPIDLTSNTVHFARPGRAFTAAVQVKADGPSIGGRVGLTWRDVNGVEISTDYATAQTVNTGGLFVESTVTAVAPANTAGVSVSVQADGPATFKSATLEQSLYSSGSTPVEWRANSIEFAYGKVLVGDGLAGRIGFINRDTHQEFDFAIPWVTTSSPITKDRRLLTHNRVEIEIDAGRSTSNDPRVWLQWSDDDGRTWSKAHPRSMGAAGKFKTRLAWHNLGSARSRIYRLFGDDPGPTAIVAAYADVQMGA